MKMTPACALVLDVPSFFQEPDFVAWLDNGQPKIGAKEGDVWTDVMVLVDPGLSGEGSDSDMPQHCWEVIVAACKGYYPPHAGPHIIVWLRNHG